MKKSLIIVALFCVCIVPIYADDDSFEIQKQQIWNVAKLYKADNAKRTMRLPAAPKANIARPVYRPRTKRTISVQVPAAAVVAAPVADLKPRVLDFSSTTAWGSFKVTVFEYPDKPYFELTFESVQPVQGLVIRDVSKKIDVLTKYLNDVKVPDEPIRINYAYRPDYVLILKANIDGEIKPQIIPLYKKNTVKTAQ